MNILITKVYSERLVVHDESKILHQAATATVQFELHLIFQHD